MPARTDPTRYEQIALTLLSFSTDAEAAAKLGISVKTIQRLRSMPAFRRVLTVTANAMFQCSAQRLQASAILAVQTLEEIMSDRQKAPAARVSAAKALLENAGRFVEISGIMERLERVELQTNEHPPQS